CSPTPPRARLRRRIGGPWRRRGCRDRCRCRWKKATDPATNGSARAECAPRSGADSARCPPPLPRPEFSSRPLSPAAEQQSVEAERAARVRQYKNRQQRDEGLRLGERRAAARHARAEKIIDQHEKPDRGGEAGAEAEQQAGADGDLAAHHQITEKLPVRRHVVEQKIFIPRINIDRGQVADLPADPVAPGKIALKFAKALLQQVKARVDAQDREVPEIGAFLEIHPWTPRRHGWRDPRRSRRELRGQAAAAPAFRRSLSSFRPRQKPRPDRGGPPDWPPSRAPEFPCCPSAETGWFAFPLREWTARSMCRARAGPERARSARPAWDFSAPPTRRSAGCSRCIRGRSRLWCCPAAPSVF